MAMMISPTQALAKACLFCKLSFLSDCLQLKEGSTDTHSFSSGYARNRSLAVFSLLGFYAPC